MKITDEFLAELEAAAKAATQGEWEAVHGGVGCDGEECSCVIAGLGRVADDVGTQNACYIAAAQPAHVLALIAELREARLGLLQCADWFGGYAEGHEAKGDVDKATRNRGREAMARRCVP